jgi:hypothetical protein
MKKDTFSQILEEYLDSVKNLQEAKTDPFFYTRLRAKMQKQDGWTFPVKPAWIVTTLALLLMVNGFMILNHSKTSEQKTLTSAPLQRFALAYDLSIQSTY